MKRFLLLGTLCLALANVANAQTWSEWFRQKKTQKKYLLAQIAALQVYIGYAKKGYEIADKGISTVNSIKRGDFDLHDEFITSLSKVNPNFGKYAKVADIIACHMRIVRQVRQTGSALRQSNQFTPADWAQFNKATEALLKDCVNVVESLILVITDGQLQMSDADRLKHIDRLYLDVQAKFAFATAFTNEAKTLCLQRTMEQADIDFSKRINGLK